MSSEEEKKLFISEAEELVQKVEYQILKLEDNPKDKKPIQELYFNFHTLKGMTGMVGLDNVSKLCHSFETLLDKSKEKGLDAQKAQKYIELMFKTLDILKNIVKNIKSDIIEDIDSSIVDEFEDLMGGKDDNGGYEITFIKTIPSDKIDTFLSEKDRKFYKVFVRIQSSCVFKKVRLFIIFRALNDIGSILWSDPEPHLLEEANFDFDFEVYYTSKSGEKEIDAALEEILEIEDKKISKLKSSEIKPIIINAVKQLSQHVTESAVLTAAETPSLNNNSDEDSFASLSNRENSFEEEMGQITSIKVDIDTLEHLMDYFGELIVLKNQLSQILIEKSDWEINRVFDNMDKLFLEIQEIIFKLKLVRVSSTFRRYKRLVRDVAKETEKNVRFILEGTDVELDRKILEELNSPLIHILRNSIYHGIESPSQRIRKGKPEQGTILLRTIRREGAVHIQIKDDGAGLDYEEIKNKAVKNGLYTREEVEKLDKNELNKIIFQPGFSTLKSADMISGRGMGLAIVSEKIKELSGELRLESEPGKGCTFTLAVPFSRAILKAQLMKIAGDLYAIPIENINQIYFFKRELIEYVKGKEYYRLNEKLVPIVRLKEYLNIESEFDTIEIDETEGGEAATKIVENNLDKFDKIAIYKKKDEDNAVLFVVDEIMQQMDVVIKPFRSKFSQFQDVLGVTITGDGSICLIIDVLSLISRMANEMKTLSVIKNTEQKITH